MGSVRERGEGSDKSAEKELSESALSRIPVKHFGPYNLIGRLGFGGMAEVFLAFTSGPGGVRKLCVVKRLHRHLRKSKDFVRMFLDEARLAARLNHPNVIQTYELGEIDGAYFISMEYLQGQSFDRLMRLRDKGDPARWYQLVARVLSDALEGLHYAHELADFDGTSLSIIHRDISPQNIFVSYEGISKILDFGVAKATTQADTTESGVLKGKCSYVAPEQAHGDPLDRRVDLWSMGVVLWEGVTGRRLFKSATNAATLLEVLTAQIPLVMDVAPDMPLTLGQVIEKALQRKPEKRYATALKMKEDLDWYFREIPKPITREEVGAFLSAAFGDVRARQARVVEECLADATASKLPRTGKRTPKTSVPFSSSIESLNFNQNQNQPAREDSPDEERSSDPGMAPVTGERTRPDTTPSGPVDLSALPGPRDDSGPSTAPGPRDDSGPSPTPGPASRSGLERHAPKATAPSLFGGQSRGQQLLFGAMTLLLAVLSAALVAISSQWCEARRELDGASPQVAPPAAQQQPDRPAAGQAVEPRPAPGR
jgi:serine/threonine-protein kinase